MEGLRQFLKSWMGKVLLILCLAPLVVLGLESYFSTQVNPNEIVKVDDTSIDTSTYQNIFNDRRQILVQQVGDASAINENVLKKQVLQSLIDRALIENQINKLGMTISDEVITEMLKKEPAFLDSNGKFSNDLFANFLQSRRMTKEQLFQSLRTQMTLAELNSNIVKTAVYPMTAINNIIDLQSETRPLWIARLKWQPFASQVTISEKEIQDYYNQHQKELKSQEMVDINYIEVNKNQINVPAPTAEEIQQQYQAYLTSQKNQQQHEVAMILMSDEKAQTTLENLKNQLDTKKADFATLAKQYSEDEGSKNSGGNIGSLTPEMFPNDYENVITAVKALKEGEVSAPIKTQYGYHLFKLMKISGDTPASLDSMKDSLTEKALAHKKEVAYQDLVKKINDLAVDGSTIADIASQENLSAKTLKNYPKTNNNTTLNQPAVINAAFDEFALQDNSVSVGIELADKTVWVQANNFRPVKNLSLSEATEQIRQTLTEEKAKDLALAQAKTIANQVQQKNSVNVSADFVELGKVGRQMPILSPEERSIAFSQPATVDKLAVMTQKTSEGASVIVGGVIEKTSIAQLTDEQKKQTARMIRENIGQSHFEDYLAYLRSHAKIKVNDKALNAG